jgi:arylsulfatase
VEAAGGHVDLALGFEPATDAHSRFLVRSLQRADWRREEAADAWVTALPVRAVGAPPANGPPYRLYAPGDAGHGYAFVPSVGAAAARAALRPGAFLLHDTDLLLRLEAGEAPPERLVFEAHVSFSSEVDGRRRVHFAETSADGIAIAPGTRERLPLELTPGRVLRFATAAQRLGSRDEELVFRVRLGDRVLFETPQNATARETVVWHDVRLPDEAAGAAELVLEVDGPAALAAILAPTLGPTLAPERRDAEPAVGPRPDVVLFVADTLRADALAAYGGAGSAPRLDALAEQSLVFTRAITPATWTLPAQTSMLTGLYPMQHGATTKKSGVPAALVTLAKHLAAHGYRTGAVTEGVFVSREHGMDQGFAYWHESADWNLARTLATANAFLDAGDGRPTFLLVHTYRTHAPYRDRTTADGRELQTEWDALAADTRVVLEGRDSAGTLAPSLAPLATRLRALYERGVGELDRAVAPFVAGLRARGMLERGYFVLTSDHGEAFLEHGELFHAGRPYAAKVRVPLLVHGGGVAPGVVEHAASLVDLPATVASLAGLAPDPGWGGRALLELDTDRPQFAFETGEGALSIGVVAGARLVLAPADPARLAAGEVQQVFELDTGRVAAESASASRAARQQAATIEALLRPLVEARAVTLDAARHARLEDLGYGGD